jgi:hypothetical protein
MKHLILPLLLLAPTLMAPTCGGSSSGPGFGGGGSSLDPDDGADSDEPEEQGGGNTTECEPEYTTVEVSCSGDHYYGDIWHIYVELAATCSWIDVAFDGTSYGGVVTGSGGIFEGDLAYTGMRCDEPHTLDFECIYMMSNYDCTYEYSP